MKNFKVCVESYFSNNSDNKEYDIYSTVAESLEEAREYAIMCINNWSKENKGVIYHVYNVEEEK